MLRRPLMLDLIVVYLRASKSLWIRKRELAMLQTLSFFRRRPIGLLFKARCSLLLHSLLTSNLRSVVGTVL